MKAIGRKPQDQGIGLIRRFRDYHENDGEAET
jgi:hypothetical protein